MANPFVNAAKFLTAINLLASPAGTPVPSLMDNLGISRRSSFRLLDALEELGFPLTDGQLGNEKTYRLIDSYVYKLPNMSIPNPCFTGEEIELVLSILDLCKQLNKISETPRLNAIREKIKAFKAKDGKKNAYD
jgi:predicted DNA-binding transcriptional regulator YafY